MGALARELGLAAVMSLLVACGARSGLSVEQSDGETRDAEPDVGSPDGGLADGTLLDWPPVDPFRPTLMANGQTTCVLDGVDDLHCWGLNSSSMRGSNPFPLRQDGLSAIRSVSVGQEHYCAVDGEGAVFCHGPVGNWGVRRGEVELTAMGLPEAVGVGSGNGLACAVMADGWVSCWGSGIESEGSRCTMREGHGPERVPGVEDAVAVKVGELFACSLSRVGEVRCWGCNSAHRSTAEGGPAVVEEATRIPLEDPAEQLVLGSEHACALTVSGELHCWGDNSWGQLAVGDRSVVLGIARVELPEPIVQVAAGDRRTCVLTVSGRVLCSLPMAVAAHEDGSCEGSTIEGRFREIEGLEEVTEIDVGFCHLCARIDGGGVACKGCNWSGQVGDGTTSCRTVPTTVF